MYKGLDLETIKEIERQKDRVVMKARKRVISKLLEEFYYELYVIRDSETIKSYIYENEYKIFDEFMENKQKCRKMKWKYVMVTVNYKEGIEAYEMKKLVYKFRRKVCIENMVYRWECRGINEQHTLIGQHVHMLCDLRDGKSFSQFMKETRNSFKNVIGNPMHVNFRMSNLESAFREYVKGYKQGQKKEHFKLDEVFNVEMLNN